MKCLSLWQPWATLVVLGQKKIETRSWGTSYRGPLAIHASSRWKPNEILALIDQEPFKSALGEHRGNLPRGCILGTVMLETVQRTDVYEQGFPLLAALSEQERAFGDYGPRRWAWLLSNPVRRVNPIPWRAWPSLFSLPKAVSEMLEAIPEQA